MDPELRAAVAADLARIEEMFESRAEERADDEEASSLPRYQIHVILAAGDAVP